MSYSMEIILLLAGLFVGFTIAFFSFMLKLKGQENKLLSERNDYEGNIARLEERVAGLADTVLKLEASLKLSESEREYQLQKISRIEAESVGLKEKLAMQIKEMEELQKKFSIEFENTASRILKQNSLEFTQVNQRNIGEILNPLKEKLQLFERKVDETYEKGLKDQIDLKAELKKLSDLNQRIGEEAGNLTRALKGDVKKQGNWGEVVLERILERSGLTEGREYKKQFSASIDDGIRLQPDIIIYLPEQKHMVVDSKVSLVAYDRMVNAPGEDDRQKHMKDHLQSIRNHVKLLGAKHYQNIPGLNCPDFVLLFIPIESSFSVAVQADQELFSYAWDNKVVIVSPSTLLATLRTIASIWQQENQARNAMEIARQGGLLYDKFSGFIADMEKIGVTLEQTRKSYDLAFGKLSEGRGNLIRSAERLRELGAKTGKRLPDKYLED